MSDPAIQTNTKTPRTTRSKTIFFILFASAAFSTAGPLARSVRPLHPMIAGAGRVALASLLLIAIDRGRTFAAFRRADESKRKKIIAAGLVLAVHFALFLWGLDTTSLPAAISLLSLEPLSIVLCAWLFFGIRPKKFEQLGLLLAMLGSILLAGNSGQGEHRLLGDLLVLASVGLYGVYVAIARAVGNALPATSYAGIVYGTAAIALTCALPFTPGALENLRDPPTTSLLAIVGLACIPTLLGHTSIQMGARFLAPSTLALVAPAEVLGGLFLSALLFHAMPSAFELVGALIILIGTTVAILGSEASS